MRYPELVRRRQCIIPIKVFIESNELTEQGAPEVIKTLELLCNYRDSSKKVMIEKEGSREYVQVYGEALFPGDIAPEITVPAAGTVEIFGEEHQIARWQKNRNPDGTVNYTRLELI